MGRDITKEVIIVVNKKIMREKYYKLLHYRMTTHIENRPAQS